MRYLVVVTPTEHGFTAWAPDVEGCVATGRTKELVERQMRAALEFHITALRQRGEPAPESRAYATQFESVASRLELTSLR